MSCYTRPVTSKDVSASLRRRQFTSTPILLLLLMAQGAGCGSRGGQAPDGGAAGTGTAGSGGGAGNIAGSGGNAGSGGMGGSAAVAQTCVPPAELNQPAAKLSQTGCMDPADPKKMAASVVAYEVNSPLWSDGADKQRGMALPTGGKIHVKSCASAPAECPQGL